MLTYFLADLVALFCETTPHYIEFNCRHHINAHDPYHANSMQIFNIQSFNKNSKWTYQKQGLNLFCSKSLVEIFPM